MVALYLLRLLIAGITFQASSSFTTHSKCKHSFITKSSQSKKVSKSTSTQLYDVITGTKDEELIDEGLGGVRLANENALKVSGSNGKKKGGGIPEADALTRYSKITTFEESILSTCGSSVICKGTGNELYQDPGKGLEKNVIYAPSDAVRDALSSGASVSNTKKLVFNFLGGDDLKPLEVMDAVEILLEGLNVNTDTKIEFNSLSFNEFPEEVCTVTVVSAETENVPEDPLEKSLQNGEIYFHSGKWHTVLESDLNTAQE